MVLEAVEEAGKQCLPLTGGGKSAKSKITPGWSEYVAPFKKDSKFWCSIWLSAGKPISGVLFDLMRKTKYQYKYAVRRLQRVNSRIQNDKFLESILRGGVNIFDEIKRFRGKAKQCSSRIDDEVGAANISQHFGNIYSDLFNKVDLGHKFDTMCEEISVRLVHKAGCRWTGSLRTW